MGGVVKQIKQLSPHCGDP